MITLERLAVTPIVAILRGNYRQQWTEYAEALLEGGITTLEITLNSPGALAGITEISSGFRNRLIVGAGTVLTGDQANDAIDAGATFIVAPDTDEDVIRTCLERNTLVIPGAYTPTEIKRAYLLGAPIVKLFPAQTPAYVKAVRAPLDHIPLMTTGGISVDNAAAYLDAGAALLGVGSNLTADSLMPEQVAEQARKYIAALESRNTRATA